ncbi:class I SAM-dependent methyltransferase [Streptomyces sp. NPDC056159]|uniref:class I SAM-dependent DNA methyltransferase n=1 Tax=Streptomyces sp. NPDC056159 TaxID=3155537 RepID=UPI00343AD4C7
MERETDVAESVALPADPAQANDYDSFAEAYSAESESNLVNAYYARPAMLALAGDVAGRRILDAGCGSGPLSAALRDRGAVVTGVDASAAMLALARRRLGNDVALHLADLSSPLPFDDGAFDDVVADSAATALAMTHDLAAQQADILHAAATTRHDTVVTVVFPFGRFLHHCEDAVGDRPTTCRGVPALPTLPYP